MRIRVEFLVSITLLASINVSAQERSTEFKVRPGITHFTHHLPGPNVVNVVAIRLHEARFIVLSYRPESLTTVTQQVEQARTRGMDVIAAINADFFSFQTHLPVGIQMSQGRIVHAGPSSRRSQIAFTQDGSPIMDRQQFSGAFRIGQGSWNKLDGVNCSLDSARVVLYNNLAGGRLHIRRGARFYVLRTAGASWSPGDTLLFVVAGPHPVPEGPWTPRDVVLAFDAYAPAGDPGVGDTIRALLSVGVSATRMSEALGGGGRILLNGVPADDRIQALESIGIRFTTDRHPRTFVAIDRDTSMLFLCVVDGRQASSIGMNFREMAEFLLWIGGWNAVNLDGGGSTVMLVEGRTVNTPSDRSGERAVANALMILGQEDPP